MIKISTRWTDKNIVLKNATNCVIFLTIHSKFWGFNKQINKKIGRMYTCSVGGCCIHGSWLYLITTMAYHNCVKVKLSTLQQIISSSQY